MIFIYFCLSFSHLVKLMIDYNILVNFCEFIYFLLYLNIFQHKNLEKQ